MRSAGTVQTGLIEIELLPHRFADFTGSRQGQEQQAQSQARCGISAIGFQRMQEPGQFCGGKGRPGYFLAGFELMVQFGRRIGFPVT